MAAIPSCSDYPLACTYGPLFATAILLSVGLAMVGIAVAVRSGHRAVRWSAGVSIAAFTMLGFVVGLLMSQSREPAVQVVLPAILTLLGGLLVYLIGVHGLRNQAAVSAMVFCFTLSLLTGAQYGARLRADYDLASQSPEYLVAREEQLESGRHEIALKRLLHRVELLTFIRDVAKEEGIDPAILQAAVLGAEAKQSPAEPKKADAADKP